MNVYSVEFKILVTSCPRLLDASYFVGPENSQKLTKCQNMFDVRLCRHREGQVNIQFNPTFVVDVEPVILTPACDVVTVSCQANKVLLINMTCRVKNMHICHQKI